VYVCLCNGVTERDIQQAALAGCRSMPELTMRTGCGATCGSCVPMASDVLREARQATVRPAHESGLPVLAISHAA
jgi:bacterioferritin-associated ferredoxin